MNHIDLEALANNPPQLGATVIQMYYQWTSKFADMAAALQMTTVSLERFTKWVHHVHFENLEDKWVQACLGNGKDSFVLLSC